MPRRAHRRCKEQGPTCLGITHPGFDICSRCLYDVVRPRQRQAKQEAKLRKANRLSAHNRALINEVDLAEPQLRQTLSVEEVIREMDLDRQVHERLERHPDGVGALHEVMMDIVNSEPTVIDLAPVRKEPEDMPEPEAPATAPVKRNSGHGGRQSKLSDEQWQEALDAYTSGMATKEICEAWSVNIGSLYARINRAGLPKRGQKDVPHVTKTSPEVSPVQVEPAPSNGVVSGLTEWVVTYTVTRTETEKVYAKTFSQAAAAVEAQVPDAEIVSVAKVSH